MPFRNRGTASPTGASISPSEYCLMPTDHLVFSSDIARAGKFICRPEDTRFRDSGPADNYLVVFPRTSVYIRHAGSQEFVADPTLSTIYNAGQEYTRAELHHEGDRCDWYGVSREVALEIAGELNPRAYDLPERPFDRQFAPVDPSLYLAQRTFLARLERGSVDNLEAEETIIGLVSQVIARAAAAPAPACQRSNEAHRELVQRARAVLLESIEERLSVAALAARLGVSAFHLCRVFREQTGMTLHGFKIDVRLRTVLERLEDPRADLSRIAVDFGFASHSHFSAMLRRRFGRAPREIRHALTS